MVATGSLPETRPRAGWLFAAARRLAPPIGEIRFWVVQFGLVSLAGLDAIVDVHRADLGDVPPSITISLLLAPVIYAALNFGVRGAVITALWATVLAVPHWMLVPHLTAAHRWTEAAFLLVLNAVAMVVGQRVEREQRARQRAESALRVAKLARTRYQSLFEDQPAPVIITDAAGEVVELNSAASRLFATGPGRRVEDLLGAPVTTLLDGVPGCLAVRGPAGPQRLFVPTARRLANDDGSGLVQVLLGDVTEQHRRQEEQRVFATRLMRVQEEERHRLARELHDDSLQDLTYLARALEDLSQHPGAPVELAERLRHGGALATGAATTLRKLIQGLRPPVLDDLGLTAAVNQLAQQVRRRGTLTVDVRVTGTAARLDPEVELAAYRIVQESLNNVIKHAHADRVTIELCHGDTLALTITDDGRGLVTRDAARGGTRGGGRRDGSTGLGLLGMRERVNMVGGSLDVGSAAPHGTRVRAHLPTHGPAPAS